MRIFRLTVACGGKLGRMQFHKIFVIFAILLSTGCGEKKGGQGGPPPVPVSFVELTQEQLAERVTLLGESRSDADGAVNSLTNGVVSRLLVDVGDEVVAGEEVAYLDGVEQRIALAEAEARLAEGQAKLNEYLNGTRPSVLRQRESETKAAQARLREAENRLKAVRQSAPNLVKQVEGDYRAAKAAEEDAADNFRRTQELVNQGALSERDLVSVRAARDRAKGELLRAEQARDVQATNNERDLADAEAAVEMARAEVARYQALLAESREGVRAEVVDAQREVVAALRAARDRAEVDYQRTIVKANSRGTIKSRVASVGDRLEAGDPVFELGGRDVEFYFEVPEGARGKVKAGQTVLLGPDEIEGKVAGVAQAVNKESRRQSIRVTTSNESFLPGEAVSAVLLLPVQGDYLVTKRDALVDKKGQWVLFTVGPENKAEQHNVDLVAGVGEKVAVRTSELKADTEIVGRGAPGLYPGATVVPPKPQDTPTPGASPNE